MADVNDIKAGEYELVADHWDETTSKPGEPWTYVRHYKGEKVTLNQAQARRLVQGGAVVKPGARELAEAQRLQAQFQALLAQMPDALRSQLTETDPAKLAESAGETPVEEARVGDPGAEIQNEGERPRVASASSGEGDGETQEPGQTEPAKSPAKAAQRSGRS